MTDNATLELGNSGNITWNGFFNPSSTGYLAQKGTALAVSGTGTGNISAKVIERIYEEFDGTAYSAKAAGVVMPAGGTASVDAWFYIDAIGVVRTIIAVGYTGAVNDFWDVYVNATGHVGFIIGQAGAGARAVDWTSTDPITAGSWHLVTATYNSGGAPRVNVYIDGTLRAGGDAGVGGNVFQPNTNLYIGSLNNVPASPWLGDIDEVRISDINRTLADHQAAYNSGNMVEFTTDANTISLWHLNEGSGNPYDDMGNNNLTNTNVVWGENATTVNSNVITAGEHVLMFYIAGGVIGLKVDGDAASTTVFTNNITPNSENWTFCDSNILLYIDNIFVQQAGATTGNWTWEYAATFADISGNGNTLTPSFMTTATDPDVTATLSAFYPTAESQAPAFAVGAGPDFLSTNITISANFTTGNATLAYPGSDVIQQLVNQTGVPYQIPSTFIATFLILITSMAASYFMRRNSSMSFFVKSIVNTFGYGIAVALQVFDWWMIIFFFITEISFWFAVAERRQ